MRSVMSRTEAMVPLLLSKFWSSTYGCIYLFLWIHGSSQNLWKRCAKWYNMVPILVRQSLPSACRQNVYVKVTS